MIRFLTAGESHGPVLTAIAEGFPANLPLDVAQLQADLDRRRQGYGRGGRMKLEGDRVTILAGVRHGLTLGSPIALQIANKDWERWQKVMSATADQGPDTVEIAGDERLTRIAAVVRRPRPGHADLAGALKYQQRDIRNILERASARETAARVGVGAIARQLLDSLGIAIFSGVLQIGEVKVEQAPESFDDYRKNVASSTVSAPEPHASARMMQAIDQAQAAGDSLGGVIEVWATGVPVGLGSHVHWDRRLDARLSGALMSIPAIKGVAFGLGFDAAARPGSKVHDPLFYRPDQGFSRSSNHAGGVEGGISNGEPLHIRLAMKPIPTLYQPLQTVDLDTKEATTASVERSDTCAVPAAAVVAEAMVCWVLAEAVTEKFGGDSLAELQSNLRHYQEQMEV